MVWRLYTPFGIALENPGSGWLWSRQSSRSGLMVRSDPDRSHRHATILASSRRAVELLSPGNYRFRWPRMTAGSPLTAVTSADALRMSFSVVFLNAVMFGLLLVCGFRTIGKALLCGVADPEWPRPCF